MLNLGQRIVDVGILPLQRKADWQQTKKRIKKNFSIFSSQTIVDSTIQYLQLVSFLNVKSRLQRFVYTIHLKNAV